MSPYRADWVPLGSRGIPNTPKPRIHISGLTTTQARRVADVGDALVAGGLGVEAFTDPSHYVPVETCNYCGWEIEAGHCYTCRPVWGYGEGRLPLPGSRATKRSA